MRIGPVIACAVLVLAVAPPALSDPAPPQEGGPSGAKKEASTVVYRPPTRGKPRGRVGGGVRSAGRGSPALYSLVPEHTGQTISEQPSLFWYLDAAPPGDASLVFTLTNELEIDPLVEVELPHPDGAGIQRIDLARLGARLETGVEYEWSVALVVDPKRRSNDVVTAGWIDRVEPPTGLAGSATASSLAAHGLWYDALAAASDRMAASPDDADARAFRDRLLREVGLEVAVSPAGN